MVICSAFSKAMPILKAGSKGPQVDFLQRALAHIKESPGAFDGVFGEQTKAAVNRFQTSIKIYSDGIVGPDTWGALCISFSNIKKNIVFTQGSRGGEVRVLQYFLSKEDFSPGLIDGIFGDRTRNAVVQFQKSAGLIPNGIVESATWAKLLQGKLPLSSKQQERTAVAGRSTLELATLSMFQTREQKEATKNRQGIGGIEGIGVTTLQEAQNVPSLIQKLKKLGVRGGGVRTLAGLRTRLIALFRGVIGREVDMNLHVANRYLERCLTRGGALEGFTFSHLTNTLRFGKYYKDQTNGNYIAVSNIADSKRAAIVMTVRGGGGKVIFRTIEPTKQFDEPSIRFVPVRRPFEMRSKP